MLSYLIAKVEPFVPRREPTAADHLKLANIGFEVEIYEIALTSAAAAFGLGTQSEQEEALRLILRRPPFIADVQTLRRAIAEGSPLTS